MKSLLIVLTIFSAAPVFAQGPERFIEVSGTATVKADVDRISWQILIRGEGESLDAAGTALSQATEGLVDRLEALELPGESVKFSRLQSGRIEDRIDGRTELRGYFVERSAVIQLESLEPSHEVESALLVDNGIEIRNLKLESSHYEGLKQQVVVDAVAAAKQKAELMVGELEVVLGQVMEIREGTASPVSPFVNTISSPAFAQGENVDFEKVELTANVSVKFAIQ